MTSAGLAVVALMGTVSAQPPEIIERVMAVVEGQVITLSDVDAALAFGLVSDPGGGDPRAVALETLIDRALTLREVRRYVPVDPSPAFVDQRVVEMRAGFPSDAAWRRALDRTGLDDSSVRDLARDELRVRAYLGERFPMPPPPPEAEVEAYYQERRAEFTRGGESIPLAEVRDVIRRRLQDERRARMVGEWRAGLRRRGDVRILYEPPGPAPE